MKLPSEPGDLRETPSKESARDKLTAEERLLQVIENGGTPRNESGFGKILRRIRKLSFISRTGGWRRRLDFPFVNRILAVGLVLVLMAAVANVFLFKPDISHIYKRIAEAHFAPEDQAMVQPRKSVGEYLDTIGRRNLFQPGEVSTTSGEVEIPRAGIDGVLDNLALVGIAWGTYPEAMIRLKDGGRTYFVKEGEKVEQVLVKEIRKDRVIVEYGGKTREIM